MAVAQRPDAVQTLARLKSASGFSPAADLVSISCKGRDFTPQGFFLLVTKKKIKVSQSARRKRQAAVEATLLALAYRLQFSFELRRQSTLLKKNKNPNKMKLQYLEACSLICSLKAWRLRLARKIGLCFCLNFSRLFGDTQNM